jgi:hypothetical protein
MSADPTAPRGRVVRIAPTHGSGDSSEAPVLIPRSASAPATVGQIPKRDPQERRLPDSPRAAPPAAASPFDAAPPPDFDPFGPEADSADSPQFAGVVDFAPILREYVRDPEVPPPVETPAALRSLPPFPRFDTTVAAQKLGAFVKAEFGITATFAAGRRHARDERRAGAREEAAVLPTV